MDQERIGKFIKEIRKKNNLTQKDLADKYNVTYQAVSKWETGKNMPDISILKEICKDYNKDINELLTDKKISQKNKSKILFGIITLLVLVIIIFGVFIFLNKSESDNFQFKTIKTNCDNFELSGSIAYDNSKTSIYISNITYCGEDNETKYQEIECIFYEVDGQTKREIDSYKYNEGNITLEEFLKQVKFNVDHYSTSCKMYKENALSLEIKATDKEGQTTFYSIPLVLEENCK